MSRLTKLGLSEDQADAVAEMLAAVERATEAKGVEAIEARRANDRKRKAEQRVWVKDTPVMSRDHDTGSHVTERDITEVQGHPEQSQPENLVLFPQETVPPSPPKGGSSPTGKSTETASKPTRKSQRSPEAPMDPDWELPEAGRQFARSKGFSDTDIRNEFDRFKARSLAKGVRMVDWLHAWRNWVLSPFCKPSLPRDGPVSRPVRVDNRMTAVNEILDFVRDQPPR